DGAGVDRVVQELRSLVDSTREVDAFPAAVVVVVAERLSCTARVVEVAGAVGVLVGLLEPPQAWPVVDVPRAGNPTGGVDLGKFPEILRGVEGGRGGIDLRRPDAPRRVRPRGSRHRQQQGGRSDEGDEAPLRPQVCHGSSPESTGCATGLPRPPFTSTRELLTGCSRLDCGRIGNPCWGEYLRENRRSSTRRSGRSRAGTALRRGRYV